MLPDGALLIRHVSDLLPILGTARPRQVKRSGTPATHHFATTAKQPLAGLREAITAACSDAGRLLACFRYAAGLSLRGARTALMNSGLQIPDHVIFMPRARPAHPV